MRLLLVLLLVGCATPQERAQALIRAHGPYCEALGYKRNTDPWRQCIQQREDRNNAAVDSIRAPQICNRVGNQIFCF